MLYSTDGETWSEEIPAGTEAGAYTVYYKAAGAEGYEDSEVGSVSVTISAQEQPEETEEQKQEAEAGELPGETEGQGQEAEAGELPEETEEEQPEEAEEQEAEAGEQPAVLEAAGEGDTPSGSCGDGVVWELDSTGTTLTVSYTGFGTGAMQNYGTPGDAPWFPYLSSITSVSIGSGVTNIGSYAFYGLLNLSDVLIPGSVETIGENAFRGCTSLSSVTLSEGVKSIEDR